MATVRNFRQYQLDAIRDMRIGSILCGGVGAGKSYTALGFYFNQEGGDICKQGSKMDNPRDLYIITTARKRDTKEWESEMAPFLISSNPELDIYPGHKVIVDSWNNIAKYVGVEGAFFIFDEQRVVGWGKWSKSFLKITKANDWILLSATPGDKWEDYIPVFIANGFYKTKTEFKNEHLVYTSYLGFPKVDRYLNTRRLERLRDKILVKMDYHTPAKAHHCDIFCDYNLQTYRKVTKERWDPFKDEPIENASGFCYCLRKIVNLDESRQVKLLELAEKHPKIIIFYNFDDELEVLKNNLTYHFAYDNGEIAEWNGHKHQPIPETEKWAYLVQYNAGSEGWNCTKTDTIIFYSQNYSYKTMIQAAGRIDRCNTPYTDLYFYHLKSRSAIDLSISKALSEKKTFNEGKFAKF